MRELSKRHKQLRHGRGRPKQPGLVCLLSISKGNKNKPIYKQASESWKLAHHCKTIFRMYRQPFLTTGDIFFISGSVKMREMLWNLTGSKMKKTSETLLWFTHLWLSDDSPVLPAARAFKKNCIKIFDESCFNLYKWHSNIIELEVKKDNSQMESDKSYPKK